MPITTRRLSRLLLGKIRSSLLQQTVNFPDQLKEFIGILLGRSLFAKLLPTLFRFTLHKGLPLIVELGLFVI